MRIILFTLLSFCFARPSEIESQCSYYVQQCQAETSANVSPAGKTPCSTDYAKLTDCDAATYTKTDGSQIDISAATYWECVVDKLNPTRSSMSKTTGFMEACFYEEHKDLLTYSYYADNGDGKEPSKGQSGLELTTFSFSEGPYYTYTNFNVTITLNWANDINVIEPPVDCGSSEATTNTGCAREFWKVYHVNLHACLLTEELTTCSIKFPNDATASGPITSAQGIEYKGDKGDVLAPVLRLDTPGTYKLMGHIRYYTQTGDQQTLWDIGMTKEINVTTATSTERPGSSASTICSLAGVLIWLLGFM